jgi:opacity protein-like surface antigen
LAWLQRTENGLHLWSINFSQKTFAILLDIAPNPLFCQVDFYQNKEIMKKLSIVAAAVLGLCQLGAIGATDVSVDMGAGFRTRYVEKGAIRGKEVFTSDVKIGVKVMENCRIYGGVESFMSARTGSTYDSEEKYLGPKNLYDRAAPFVGVEYEVSDALVVDVGYKHNFYPKISEMCKVVPVINSVKKCSGELYAGISYDYPVAPSLYISYDFQRRGFNAIGALDYEHALGGGLKLKLGASIGYDVTKKPFACKFVADADAGAYKDLLVGLKESLKKKGYVYYGVTADLVYSFNEHASASIGIGFAGNGAKRISSSGKVQAGSWVNDDNKKNNLWFSASVDCNF